MNKKIFLVLFLYLSGFCMASANLSFQLPQLPVSFRQELEVAKAHMKKNMLDSAELSLRKVKSMLPPLKDTIGTFNYLQYLDAYHDLLFRKSLHEQAKQVSQEMLRVSKKTNDKKHMAEAFYGLALNQSKLGQWSLAADNITKALKVSEGLYNTAEKAKYYFFLSDVFFELREGNKSLDYSTKAYSLLSSSGNTNLIKERLDIALLEMLSGQDDLALRHLQEAERNIDKAREPLQVARIYLFLSHAYVIKKQFDHSLIELNKIPEYYTRINNEDPGFKLHTEMAMAETHYGLGNYERAKYYFNRNINQALREMDTSDIRECYQLGSRIYEALGDKGTALDYLKRYIVFSDSANSVSMKKAIHETDIKYQTTLKEKAIADQKLLIMRKDYELHRKDRYLIFGCSAIVLLILSVVIVYLVYRNRNQAIELTLLKAQIHPHFLFNTLNNLFALCISKSDAAPGVVLGLANILRYILYECNSVTADLQKELDIIAEYVALEKIRHVEGLEVNTYMDPELRGYTVAPLLLLPLVENAYKHGVNKLEGDCWINIEARIRGNKFIFKISNNKPLTANRSVVKSK
ncbi:hypothetical protein DBR11_23960, partial [Pedobacter sp. HMWF019]